MVQGALGIERVIIRETLQQNSALAGAYIMSENIEYVELQIVDILGRLKAMIVPCEPAKSLEDIRSDPVMEKGISIDGSSIVGLSRVEASDLRLKPDKSSLIELPYTSRRVAAALCFVREKTVTEDAEVYHLKDCRGTLHSACEKYLPGKLELRLKIEPEFHFITFDGEPFDDSQYADTFPTNPSADLLLDISSAIRSIGLKPRVIHHEVGNAQQEIELDFEEAGKMADSAVRFKSITRAIALEEGLDVTFMPKPFANSAGNGLHCHIQLWEGDKNLFGGEDGSSLSETGRMFVAGLLEHAPAITAIANPTVNSYKRLVPHHEAPVYVCWGPMNRTALVRVPLFNESQKAAIEFRSPDPMSNPYLLFSALIAAGMDGVNRKLTGPEPISQDVFVMTESERQGMGIMMLPASLGEALDCLEKDDVIKEAIGSELVETFISLKRQEWEEYCREAVTDWEWFTYHGI